MHTAALKAAGLEGEYKEYPVKPEDLDRWLREEAPKLDGFNVTMPHKKSVLMWEIDRRLEGKPGIQQKVKGTKVIGVVNTVVMKEGRPVGHNTDGGGFLSVLTERGFNPSGWRTLLFGAGGAAEAIATAFTLETEVKLITIWNRHRDRAEEVARWVKDRQEHEGSQVKTQVAEDLLSLSIRDYDLLVNATPTGMNGEGDFLVDFNQLHSGQVVYDLVYQPRETKLIQEARKRGCTVITGDEMLAAQGALSFELWTGVKADKVVPVMRKALDEYYGRGSSG